MNVKMRKPDREAETAKGGNGKTEGRKYKEAEKTRPDEKSAGRGDPPENEEKQPAENDRISQDRTGR